MKTLKAWYMKRYFFQVSNGKFFVIEAAFIYMIFACAIAAWGTLEYYDTWYIIPFFIPFAIGFAMWQTDNPGIDALGSSWRTKLLLLKDQSMEYIKFGNEAYLEKRLDARWRETYNEDFEDMEYVALQMWHPILLVIIVLIVVWIWI